MNLTSVSTTCLFFISLLHILDTNFRTSSFIEIKWNFNFLVSATYSHAIASQECLQLNENTVTPQTVFKTRVVIKVGQRGQKEGVERPVCVHPWFSPWFRSWWGAKMSPCFGFQASMQLHNSNSPWLTFPLVSVFFSFATDDCTQKINSFPMVLNSTQMCPGKNPCSRKWNKHMEGN